MQLHQGINYQNNYFKNKGTNTMKFRSVTHALFKLAGTHMDYIITCKMNTQYFPPDNYHSTNK